MKTLIIEQEEIQLLNQGAKAMQSILDLPNYGSNFPSLDNETYYDTSRECGIAIDGKSIQLSLHYENNEDHEDYKYYNIIAEDGEFTNSILRKLTHHNEQYKE